MKIKKCGLQGAFDVPADPENLRWTLKKRETAAQAPSCECRCLDSCFPDHLRTVQNASVQCTSSDHAAHCHCDGHIYNASNDI